MVFEKVRKVICNNAGHTEMCHIYHFKQDSKIIASYTLLGSKQCIHTHHLTDCQNDSEVNRECL